jgi:virulence-associated protein VagC
MDVILPQQYRLPEDKIVIRMVGCVATILPTEASSISRTAA